MFEALTHCKSQLISGQTKTEPLIEAMKQTVQKRQGQIDYIGIVDPQTLEPLEQIEQKALVLLAVYIGKTRLIDNLLIDLNTL